MYVPVQDELKAKLEAFRDEMQGYVYQGVPPTDASTATGTEDGGYTSQFGGASNQNFGAAATAEQAAEG